MSSKRDRILFFADVLMKLCINNNVHCYFIVEDLWHEKFDELRGLNKSDLNSGSFLVNFPNKDWLITCREIPECTESEIEGWFYANLIQSSF